MSVSGTTLSHLGHTKLWKISIVYTFHRVIYIILIGIGVLEASL